MVLEIQKFSLDGREKFHQANSGEEIIIKLLVEDKGFIDELLITIENSIQVKCFIEMIDDMKEHQLPIPKFYALVFEPNFRRDEDLRILNNFRDRCEVELEFFLNLGISARDIGLVSEERKIYYLQTPVDSFKDQQVSLTREGHGFSDIQSDLFIILEKLLESSHVTLEKGRYFSHQTNARSFNCRIEGGQVIVTSGHIFSTINRDQLEKALNEQLEQTIIHLNIPEIQHENKNLSSLPFHIDLFFLALEQKNKVILYYSSYNPQIIKHFLSITKNRYLIDYPQSTSKKIEIFTNIFVTRFLNWFEEFKKENKEIKFIPLSGGWLPPFPTINGNQLNVISIYSNLYLNGLIHGSTFYCYDLSGDDKSSPRIRDSNIEKFQEYLRMKSLGGNLSKWEKGNLIKLLIDQSTGFRCTTLPLSRKFK